MATAPAEPGREWVSEERFYSPADVLDEIGRDPRPWRGGGQYVVEDLKDEESERFWEALADT